MALSLINLPYVIVGAGTPGIPMRPVQSFYTDKQEAGVSGLLAFGGDSAQIDSCMTAAQYGGGLPVGIFCNKIETIGGLDYVGYWDSEANPITSQEDAENVDIYGCTLRTLFLKSNVEGVANTFNGDPISVVRFGTTFRVWVKLASLEDEDRIATSNSIKVVVANHVASDEEVEQNGRFMLGCVSLIEGALPENVFFKTLTNARLISRVPSNGSILIEIAKTI